MSLLSLASFCQIRAELSNTLTEKVITQLVQALHYGGNRGGYRGHGRGRHRVAVADVVMDTTATEITLLVSNAECRDILHGSATSPNNNRTMTSSNIAIKPRRHRETRCDRVIRPDTGHTSCGNQCEKEWSGWTLSSYKGEN